MPNYRRLYRPGALVFFTICLARPLRLSLVDEVDRLRWAVGSCLRERPVDHMAWVILPDRLHTIWRLPEGDCDYSGRWASIKGRFSLSMRGEGKAEQSPALRERRGAGIWQARFWEHHLRGPEDLSAHLEFCRLAPVRDGLVARAEDWPLTVICGDHRRVAGRDDVAWPAAASQRLGDGAGAEAGLR